MNSILHFWMGPVIGGVIGYFTNYIAIKMLFRPRKAIYIGKFRLPFTPGIIPKRKNDLAGKIGDVVAANMFTSEDIASVFLSEGMKKAVGENLTKILYDQEEPASLLNFLNHVMTEEESLDFQNRLDQLLKTKVTEVIAHTDVEGMITRETLKILLEKTNHTAASIVLTKDRAASIAGVIGRQLGNYTTENAADILMPILREEVANIIVTPAEDLIDTMDMSREQQEKILEQIYERFITDYIGEVVSLFDIAGLTRNKIIEFETEEIENLVNSTIKHEMQAVIYLGGVLGVIIGFVNSLL